MAIKFARTIISACLILGALCNAHITLLPFSVHADPIIPPVWDIVRESFEDGTLDSWQQTIPENLHLAPGVGRNGSAGFSVTLDSDASYLYQTNVARAEIGYLTFWFNPNGALIPDQGTSWVPGRSISIANVTGPSWWPPLVALYARHPTGSGYKAFLAWPTESGRHYDYESGEFNLVDGWQKITLGYELDAWVAVWLNDELIRFSADVSHNEPYGGIVEIGKTNPTDSITPTGELLFDDVAFQVPRIEDLWVDALSGDDGNDGLTITTAFLSVQNAADIAGPGTIVHILPGVYRESVWPALNGSQRESVLYIAEDGLGTATIRGSEPASELVWTQMTVDTIGLPAGVNPADIYHADLLEWGLEKAPRFVVELDDNGEPDARLPLAREPDWGVTTEWKHHEFWWAADGGWDVAGCDPSADPDPNCDYGWRSTTQLTDRTHDVAPVGIEPGNLSTLGNLAGATLVAIDSLQGHYVYRRTITSHDVSAGRVTVDRICEHDGGSGNPGLGWGSKYYVENNPGLLDTPGEWWYDENSGRLYLWPRTPGNPGSMNIEISRRDNGFSFQNRSFTILEGLTIELLNESAVYQGNWQTQKSYHNAIRKTTLRYANRGVFIEQSVRADAPSGNVIDGFTVEGSEIAHMDTHAIRLIDWWENSADPNLFTRSGVLNTVIRDNEMHHLGFRTDGDNAVGASFSFANRLRFEGNHVHHVAHNGVQFSRSVIQSSKTHGFAPHEIKTGEILIKDNVFEKACQLTTDCGAIKFWGSPPDNHVFRDLLITGNIFRNTFGWTYVSEKRGRWSGGDDSHVRGLGGFGLYVDHASGVHAYRNISYNNAYVGYMLYGVWRDGDIVYYNNIAANSLNGFSLGGASYDTHGSVSTQVINNIIVNNEDYGIKQADADGVYDNMTFDHNLFHNNGWRTFEDGGQWKAGDMVIYVSSGDDAYLQTLADIRANTAWEINGVQGDPRFVQYDATEHDLFDDSWPDFFLTSTSLAALDRGTADLPPSLALLIGKFEVHDPRRGEAFDIGRYEGGFDLLPTPSFRVVKPGGTALYTLRIFPSDLSQTVALTTRSPSPNLTVALTPGSISVHEAATLTVTSTHAASVLMPGMQYSIPVTGVAGEFKALTTVRLLVGGRSTFLPVLVKGY